MKLGIGIPLTTDREWTQFWDSFNVMKKPDYTYLRPKYRGAIDVVRNELIKQAFPSDNMQFCFNLSKKHTNVNYNMEGTWKQSGILNQERPK